jgi:hypothetical protein
MKDKSSIAKNTEMESISLKMEIFMTDKCSKEKCRERENTPGPIKMFSKARLFRIK